MSFVEKLRLVVEADMHGAVSNVASGTTKIDDKLKNSKSGFEKWGKGFQKAGIGMMAFGATALIGLGKMAMASEEANKSTLKLQNSLHANPRLAGENVKTYTDLATAIQSKTAADADDITAGIAVLAQGKLTAKQMKELIPLTVDLARKKGMDETAAFTLASKAAGGNALALKKQGIAVDETLAKTDAYKATIEALKHSVGGYAAEEGKTFSGSLQRLKNQLGDLEEGVGSGAVEAFTQMFGAIGKVSDGLAKISPELQGTIGKVGAYGATALVAAGGVSFLAGKTIEAAENFGSAVGGISRLVSSLGGLKSVLIGGAVIAGVVALSLELEKLDDAASQRRAEDWFGSDKLVANLNRSSDAAKAWTERFVKSADAMGFLEAAVKQVNDVNPQLAQKLIDIADAAGIEDDHIKRLRGSLKDHKDASKAAAEGTDQLTGALDDQAKSADNAKSSLQKWSDAQRAIFDPLFAFQDAMLQNIDAQAKVTQAELEAVGAEKELAAAKKQHGKTSEEAVEAFNKYTEAQRAVEDAHRDAIASALDFDAAFSDLKTGVENHTISLDEAKRAVDRWEHAGRIGADTANFYRGQVDNLGKSIKILPWQKTTDIKVNAVQAREQINAVHHGLEGLPLSKHIDIDIAVHTKGGVNIGGGSFKVFHEGGVVPGPRGQEIAAVLQAGEEVLSLNDPRNITNARYGAAWSSGPSMAMAAPARVIIDLRGGDDNIKRWLRNVIRTEGAGDVQQALGQRR